MTAPDLAEAAEGVVGCAHQLYPALGLQPAEWCDEDALPGYDRCEIHICDDEDPVRAVTS